MVELTWCTICFYDGANASSILVSIFPVVSPPNTRPHWRRSGEVLIEINETKFTWNYLDSSEPKPDYVHLSAETFESAPRYTHFVYDKPRINRHARANAS